MDDLDSVIHSPQNAKFKIWHGLLEARGIKKSGLALVSGRKIADEIVRHSPELCREWLCPAKGTRPIANFPTYSLSAPLFKQLDIFGTHAPLLVVRTPAIETWQPAPPDGLELIVGLSDPGNLGALLRSCAAFAVKRIILTSESCSPFLPKALRAASGTTFRLALAQTGSIAELSMLKSGFALDMQGENIAQFPWPKDLHLVLGEEGQGLPNSLKLTTLSVPMRGSVESLNATTAASIALFSYRTRWP